MAFMAFGLSNAKRDPTEEEKEDCIQPCEKEKEQLSQGNKQRWETEFYQYTMDYNNEKIFDDCTDFCIARSRYSKIWEQNHHYTQFDLDWAIRDSSEILWKIRDKISFPVLKILS